MGQHKRPRRGRGRDASQDAAFRRALLGGEESEGGRAFNPAEDRKTLQLCRQVQRALSLGLGGECADDLLRDAWVESVTPLGGPGQLLVRVVMPAGGGAGAPLPDVMARLGAVTPRLRAIVAREIHRKRVPTLSFVVVPAFAPAEGAQEGGRRDH